MWSMPAVELAACQVFVTADDYGSADRFEAMLARVGRRLDAARARGERGAFARPCVAVFPEMIGAFLPLAGRAHVARGARTTDDALTKVALREAPALVRAMARHGAWSPKVAFLVAASPGVRRIYKDAFARFARAHAAWTIAGSALLPRNAHGDLADDFEPQDGRVYNTSYAFAPDGRIAGVTRKVHLVPTLEDTLGLSPARADELTPVETPFGRVGTLICYDGFRIPHTSREPDFRPLVGRHDNAGAAVVAHPAANPWPWEERWIFADEGETQLRREQWTSEGIFSQLADGSFSHVRYAITAQLLGRVFDNRFDGRSQILARDAGGVRVLAEAARADASPEAEEVVLRAVDLPL
jgi:predicted amidohydrolase